MAKADFYYQFRKVIIRYKLSGYNLNVMRQSVCLVINSITVDNFAVLFNALHAGGSGVIIRLIVPT